MPESANALQANAAIIEMVRLSLQVHRSAYGQGLHPDLPAIAQPVIYSSCSLELLPAIAPKPGRIGRCSAPAHGGSITDGSRFTGRAAPRCLIPTGTSHLIDYYLSCLELALAVRRLSDFNSVLWIKL